MCTRWHSPTFNRFVKQAWSNDCELLRSIAAAKLKTESLQWWWCKFYHRPLRDPLLQEYTIEELQIEELMHRIEADPQEAYPQTDMANVQFRTGDPLLDDWEKKIADGRESEIDWDAGVDQTFLERFKSYSKQVAERQIPELAAERLREESKLTEQEREEFRQSLTGFNDDYKR